MAAFEPFTCTKCQLVSHVLVAKKPAPGGNCQISVAVRVQGGVAFNLDLALGSWFENQVEFYAHLVHVWGCCWNKMLREKLGH